MEDLLVIALGFGGIALLIFFSFFFDLEESPSEIGSRGEALVQNELEAKLDEFLYYTLSDLTLPTPTGTTQIDHVVVSVFGVFVVETKNMKEWIFGAERQGRWTQTLFKRSYKFQNPLWQNYKHVKTVQNLLNIGNQNIHNLVVFVRTAEPRTKCQTTFCGMNRN